MEQEGAFKAEPKIAQNHPVPLSCNILNKSFHISRSTPRIRHFLEAPVTGGLDVGPKVNLRPRTIKVILRVVPATIYQLY